MNLMTPPRVNKYDYQLIITLSNFLPLIAREMKVLRYVYLEVYHKTW